MNSKKTIIFILTAVMMLVLAAPSFAANIMETDGQQTVGEPEMAEEADGSPDEESETILNEEGDETVHEDEKAEPRREGGGIEVSYTGYKENLTAVSTTIFSVEANGISYTGTCAMQGVSMQPSGTATITRIPNSEKIAKVVYHYAIELGDQNWWDSPAATDRVGKIIGMSSANSTRVTKRRMIECFCQIYNMGDAAWYRAITSTQTGGWGTNESSRIRNYYNNIDTSGITVPDSFEMWFADAGDAQPFIIWANDSYGYVAVKKVSGNTTITD